MFFAKQNPLSREPKKSSVGTSGDVSGKKSVGMYTKDYTF